MKKVLIFDLDGTLINSLDDLAIATNESLMTIGLPIHPVESYKKFVGSGVSKLIERALPIHNRSIALRHEVRQLFDAYYAKHSKDHTKPYEEIEQILGELRGMGIKIAVVTNKPHEYAKELVRDLLGESIDFVIGQQEGIPPKPNPQGVERVLEYFSCKPSHCLYIGDSDVDIYTAQNAGVHSVGVLWGFRDRCELETAGADYIIEKPLELLHILGLSKEISTTRRL